MNKSDGQGVPNRDVNAANRAMMATQLRAQGLTYEEIAKRCGYGGDSACRKAILRELNRTVTRNVEELRNIEALRLDILYAAVWPLAVGGKDKNGKDNPPHLFAVDRLLAISERRAKLFGLDLQKDSNIAANQVIIREVPAGYLEEPKA